MIRLAPNRYAYQGSITIGIILLIALSQAAIAQKKHPKSSAGTGKESRLARGRFLPEKPIALKLTVCSVDRDLPIPGMSATTLEIDGERITLTDKAGSSIGGEVRGYARSVYWIDANLGLIFGRMNVPSTDPTWKAPTIISLILTQDRRRPRRFTLKPAEGLNPDFPIVTISCRTAEASK